jgi:hypothetical protein
MRLEIIAYRRSFYQWLKLSSYRRNISPLTWHITSKMRIHAPRGEQARILVPLHRLGKHQVWSLPSGDWRSANTPFCKVFKPQLEHQHSLAQCIMLPGLLYILCLTLGTSFCAEWSVRLAVVTRSLFVNAVRACSGPATSTRRTSISMPCV